MRMLLEEKKILMEIEEYYQKFINLLIELRRMCQLSWYSASTVIHCGRQDIQDYENNVHVMGLDKFVQYCYYYMGYIKEHHIPYTIEALEAIKEIKECYLSVFFPLSLEE